MGPTSSSHARDDRQPGGGGDQGQGGARTSSSFPVFPVLLVHFIGTLGFSIVLPFLVFLVTRFGGNAVVYGLVGATYPAFQLIGSPLLGRWSDTFGRKKILFLSQAGTLLSWGLFVAALLLPIQTLVEIDSPLFGSFTLTLPLLVVFVARALDGLTGGNISVANAYVADVTTEADRSRRFGQMGVASNLGFVLGPALAGLLGGTRWQELLPVVAALSISLLATVLIAFYLPDPRCRPLPSGPDCGDIHKVFGQEHKDCVPVRETRPAMADSLRRPGIRLMLAVYFVVFLGFNLFYTAFPVHAVRRLDWSVSDTGLFFAVLSLLMILVQGPLLKRVSTVVSEVPLIVVGNLILGGNFLLLLSPTTAAVYGAAALFALGNGLMWPSVLSLLSKLSGEQHQGTVQGLAGGIGSAASIVGLVVGGLLYEQLGGRIFPLSAAVIWTAALLSLALAGVGARVAARSTRDGDGPGPAAA